MNKTRLWSLFLPAVLALAGCTAGVPETDAGTGHSAAVYTAAAAQKDAAERKEAALAGTQDGGQEQKAGQPGKEQPAEQQDTVLLGELSCRLPVEFVQYENNPGIFVCSDYPKDIACISYIIAGYDGQEAELAQEEFQETILEDLKNDYGEDVQVEISDYENFRVEGHSAARIQMSCSLLGTDYDMAQLIILDGQRGEEHIFNFIQEEGGKWTEAFRECMDSIAFR